MNQAQSVNTKASELKQEFEAFQGRKDKIPFEELEAFFEKLEPVGVEEMLGNWKGGYFKSGSIVDWGLKDYGAWKWIGKNFNSKDEVKALMHRAFGREFNLPVIGAAHIREMDFRGKHSIGMKYNLLPIIDHFRKVDNDTLMGVMDVKGKTIIYFYLYR